MYEEGIFEGDSFFYVKTSYITFSSSPAYPKPNFRIFSPPTEYNVPNPPTPIIEGGISEILSSTEEEIFDVAGGGGNNTFPELELLHPR